MSFSKNITIKRALVPVIFGSGDSNLRVITDALEVSVAYNGEEITISGDESKVLEAERLFKHLEKISMKKEINKEEIMDALRISDGDKKEDVSKIMLDSLRVGGRTKNVNPKSQKQREYIKSILHNDLVFGIGPAGTGKTFLAMAVGIHLFMKKKVGRIILTRPAVEAGENLGFLPGDIEAKINPYLRPLYDALYAMMDLQQVSALIENGTIEIAPLAFMRGRTLNDSYIILDEAQNTTEEQMKMFLTRIGYQSKVVVTGDITQVDLPTNRKSGLVAARNILKGIKGIEFTEFSGKDVVRHPLVQKIILAYDKYDAEK